MKNNNLKIINDIDNIFVDNYKNINQYKNNINDIFKKLNIKEFNTYNKFCIDIRNIIINKINDENVDDETPQSIILKSLNQTIKNKIKEDNDYEHKILNYFKDYDVIKEIDKSL
jgi:hypothetical protein